jgi:hypothetical protein
VSVSVKIFIKTSSKLVRTSKGQFGMRESGKTHNCSISPRMLKMISSTRTKDDEKDNLQRKTSFILQSQSQDEIELLIEFKKKMLYFD